jgi:hypothetical protein
MVRGFAWESEAKLKMRGGDFITKSEDLRVLGHGSGSEQLNDKDPFIVKEGVGSSPSDLLKDGAKLYLAWVVSTV